MDDEETCPPEFTFDICDTLDDCHWYEETPGDDLNFNIMKGMGEYSNFSHFAILYFYFYQGFYFSFDNFSVQDLIDGGLVQKHGPLTDPINSTEGRIGMKSIINALKKYKQIILNSLIISNIILIIYFALSP